MKTRIIHTKIWNDNYYGGLSPIEKFLFLYFITNEAVSIIHCYECPDRKILFDTGVTKDQLEKAKKKFQSDEKIYFYKGYIYLKNSYKYEEYTGEKNEKAKDTLINNLDEHIHIWFIGLSEDKNISINTPIDTNTNGYSDMEIPTISHKSEIISHKSKVKEEKKGGAGGRKQIASITDADIGEIAQSYGVPDAFVRSKLDDIVNYCNSTGKKYSDYVATLRNWVKKDALKIREKEGYGKPKIAVIQREKDRQT